jgi:hypothetical protein
MGNLDKALLDVDIWRAYSPIVPSFTRCVSWLWSRIANNRFSVPMTLFTCVNTAWSRSIIEYGALGCSA